MSDGGRVVVVTGASSGIGRAVAHEAARRGWRVVAAARRNEALEELAAECRRFGGEVLPVSLDVANEGQVDALAEAALDRFGRIDAWVNCAGVYLVGTFEQTPTGAFRRLLDVDVLGVVYGSRAALRAFRAAGKGTLINVSSMIGGLASPYVSAYAAAKWAVRGLTLSLREEIRDQPDIHVCVVRPASIDTPIFRRAANYSGRRLKALTPTYPPSEAARTIVALLDRPKREVIIGRSGRLLAAAHAVAPGTVDRVFSLRVPRNQFERGSAALTDGNLFESSPEWSQESGDWPVPSKARRRLLLGLSSLTLLAAGSLSLRAIPPKA